MIPVYIELNAQQAYDVVHGADSIGLEVLPNIKSGSVLWLREPWRVLSDPMGCGLSNCCYDYKAEHIEDSWSWHYHVAELMGRVGGWRDADMMPPSAIRLRRRCTSVKRMKVLTSEFGIGCPVLGSHYVWHVGIGLLEEDDDE